MCVEDHTWDLSLGTSGGLDFVRLSFIEAPCSSGLSPLGYFHFPLTADRCLLFVRLPYLLFSLCGEKPEILDARTGECDSAETRRTLVDMRKHVSICV